MRSIHALLIMVGLLVTSETRAEQSVIRFDLPPTVAARTVANDSMMTAECELRVSSLVASPAFARN